MKFVFKRMNKKGFSLIELIVVIAILAIIAAVAIPRFAGIQERSAIKADAATAAEIINAARIELSDTGTTTANGTAADASGIIDSEYMTVPDNSQSGDSSDPFMLSYDSGTLLFSCTFTPVGYNTVTIVENVEFDYDTAVTKPSN